MSDCSSDVRARRGLARCACGSAPSRRKSKGRNGKMRIRVECPRCRAKTRWHDTHGGDMAEWNARFSRGEGQPTPTERRAARPVAAPGVTPLG